MPHDPHQIAHCPTCGHENPARATSCELCGATMSSENTEDGPAAVSADLLEPGTIVKGTYRIVRYLGEGGAGAVYVAEHTSLGSLVAVKTLFGKYIRDASMRRRFVEEGIIQANLNHRNIIRVTDIVDEDKLCAIMMEYVHGGSLDDWLQRREGDIDIPEMMRIFLEILAGIGHAHGQGIIHRDLKPANVLMTDDDGRPIPKITDFGIAKVLSDYQHTETGTTMGTIHYAAPEQLTDAKSVDHRADIYALGCTVYEMLTGALPFERDSLYGIMKAHIEAPRPDATALNPSIPPALAACVRRAMAIRADERYQSASDFADDVRRAIASTSAAPLAVEATGSALAASVATRESNAEGTTTPSANAAETDPEDDGFVSPMRASGSVARAPVGGAVAATAHGPSSATMTPQPRRGTPPVTLARPPVAPRDAPPPTLQRAMWIAISTLATIIVVLAVYASTNRGSNSDVESITASAAHYNPDRPNVANDLDDEMPVTRIGIDTSADDSGSEPDPANSPETNVPDSAERLAYCRALVTRYTEFDLFGAEVTLPQAIAELDENHADCAQRIAASAHDTPYDRLVAQVHGDQMRVALAQLRALRADNSGSDPCVDAVEAANTSRRAVTRVSELVQAGALLDYEIISARDRLEFATRTYASLTDTYKQCDLPTLPELPARATSDDDALTELPR